MRRTKILYVVLLLLVFVGGYLLGARGYLIPDTEIKLFKKTVNTLEGNFYGKFDLETFLKGGVNSLQDPYTVLLNPQETAALNEEVKGEYSGIGIVIELNEELLLPQIITVFRDSPAESVGLEKGDIIKAVDSYELKGKTLDEASIRIKGKVGTTVTLEIIRGERSLTFTIERQRITIPLVETNYLGNGEVGYLKINMFSENLNNQIKSVLFEFSQRQVKGVILDLRDNPGGLLSECVAVASNFVPSGTLVLTRDRNGKEEQITVKGERFNWPLVVLINNGSASASEILASAIKYYNVGTLVGEATFGKGLIQQMFTLDNGYSLKVTIQEYLTPDGSPINQVGVKPDYEVKYEEVEGKDNQLEKALEILREKIK